MTGPRNIPHLDARIYRPVTTDWRDEAVCLEEDTELFFYVDEERGAPKIRHAEEARKVCRECPVAASCLVDAVRTREMYGIRAAFDFSDPAERARARELVGAEEETDSTPPTACRKCGDPMYQRGTPHGDRPEDSRQHQARGLCSTCYVRVPAERADAGRVVAA